MNEQDPNGMSAKEPGSKLDAGKAPIMQGVIQYFPRAIKAVANLSLLGAQKYSWKGWETVPDGINRYGDAAMRHAIDEEIQGHYDLAWKEQNQDVLHATAVAWNALAKLELLIRKLEAHETPANRVEYPQLRVNHPDAGAQIPCFLRK